MPFDRKDSLPRLTFVLGGARSGKSRYAEALVEACGCDALYIATAEPLDDEMRQRIAAHRARRGRRWSTLEVPLELPRALTTEAKAGRPVLVDCLTLWLSNLMLAGRDVEAASAALFAALGELEAPAVLVANEVGLGIVPETRLGRDFRDRAGNLNREIAALAESVVFIAAGLPLVLKGGARP